MKTSRRFILFGLGLGLGLVAVFYFFSSRENTWIPGARVRMDILNNNLSSLYDSTCLKTMDLSVAELYEAMQRGKINFGQSSPRTTPKMYKMVVSDSPIMSMEFTQGDGGYVLTKLTAESSATCDIDSTKKYVLLKPSRFILQEALSGTEPQIAKDVRDQLRKDRISVDNLIQVIIENGEVTEKKQLSETNMQYGVRLDTDEALLTFTIQVRDNAAYIIDYSLVRK